MEKKVKIKRRLKLKNVVVLGLFFLLFLCFGFYLYTLPIKNILITGTNYLSDYDIITSCDLKDYPPLFRLSYKKIKEGMEALSLVEDYHLHRSIFGTLTISITEEVPLFYNRNSEKLIMASGKEMTTQDIHGAPILVNYVPDEIYKRLLEEMKKTNLDVLKLISEIEYQPWKSDDVVIDNTRFYLRMNDGNTVYVNLINFDKLNNYMTIYSTLGDKKGVLQLDSSLGNGITFRPF